MILSKRKRMDTPLLLLVWMGVASYSLAEGRWFYLLAGSFAVVVNMLAVRHAKEVHVHRAFINIAVLVATVILMIEVVAGDSPVLQGIGHYLILLQLCKLFERKTNRDYVQILILSMLTIVAGAMLYSSPWFAAMTIVYLGLLSHTAMVFTLKRGLDTAARSQVVSETEPPGVEQVAWNVIRAWPGTSLRRRGVQILTVILSVGVLVFLISPRNGSPSGLLGGANAGAVTGFSEDVRLGDHVGKVYQSNNVLMHVRFKAPQGVRIPAGPGAYLRGATFTHYSNSRWSNEYQRKQSRHGSFVPKITREMLTDTVVQEISMNPSLLPNLFVCFPAVQLSTHDGNPAFQSDLTALLQKPTPGSGHVRYTAKFLAHPLSDAALSHLRSVREYFSLDSAADPRMGVETSDRVENLARQWCTDLLRMRRSRPELRDKIDLQIARRIARNLRSQYTYTLDLSDADPSRDGVEDFLFYTRKGHCEYFASAMTVLCRTLGVRAKLVTGFVPEEYNASGGYYIIRGRDAHAWSEIFTPTTDWTPVDPTPPSGRQIHGKTRWAPLKRRWARLEFLWYEKVVGYDTAQRKRLGGWVKFQLEQLRSVCLSAWRSATKYLIGLLIPSLIRGVLDRLLVRLAILVGLIGLVLEGMLIARCVRRSLRSRHSGIEVLPVPMNRMKYLWRLLSLLHRKGFRRRPEQTLKEYLTEATHTLKMPPKIIGKLIALTYRVRWGLEIPSRQELREAESLVAMLADKLGS